jgi:tetratricopeptide (TPR) repeat protein
LRERAAARNSRNEDLTSAAGGQQSPIGFAPEQLAQPEWVEPLRPADDATTSTVQIPPTGRDIHDPFDEPGPSGPVMVAARSVMAENQLDPDDRSQKTPATADALPLIVSDYSESPDGCLAQAQQRAQTADTVDELSGIADLCQRGLASGPSPELASPLRRLAAWAHNRRGELLIDEERVAEAIKDFQIAISLDPSCSLAIHNRAVTLAQQNETAAALRDFNRVIELNPGLAVAYRNRAELLASLGRFNEAVRDYSQAIDGLSDDAELYRARGSAWHRLGEFQRSFDDLNQAIRLDPNNADAFTQRGNLEAERGHFDQAINDFQQAVTIDPNWAEAHRSMAWLQATCPSPSHRNAEQAIVAAEQAVKLSVADDCFVLDALAAAHASAGDFDEATRVQQQAVASAAPDFAEPLRQRLDLYRQGQPFISGQNPAVRPASHNTRSGAEE